MWPVLPARDTLVVIALMLVVVMTCARLVQPAWWQSRVMRTATFAAFGAMLAGVALWQVGHAVGALRAVHAGAGIAYVGILVLAPAVAVLPLSAIMDRGIVRWARASVSFGAGTGSSAGAAAGVGAGAGAGAEVSRRGMMRALPAALPAAAAITGASGFAAARMAPRMPVIPMRYDGLHPDLDGLRILQLSDLHLGACAGLDDLAKGLDAVVTAHRPDLIVLTGDLADDPGLIPGALDLVARVRARHGALASLGNHEYLHGIGVTRPRYEASAVPLLVSAGRTLRIGRARLFVGGSDDPVHMGGDIAWMLGPSIAKAASQAPPDADFRLLLCHRPEGFGPAVEHGFDLTLSGHTHGGQIGLFGRSLLEKLRPGTGWWGTYVRARPARPAARASRLARSPSRLYTTSGFGHWFPFRIGCPTEMPIIVLERGEPAGGPERAARSAPSRPV